MGYSSYSESSRSLRSEALGYTTKSFGEVFNQKKIGEIHENMRPALALLRESRDSQVHPLSLPIMMGLDVTGSMLKIPHYLVQTGLPKIMSSIIQNGCPDPQILFLGVGDHECDKYPLQVGQFESGDEELDLHLTRLYPEGGGGSNGGESYLLVYYFAALHTVTDSFEKRGQRGLIFTIGDEPSLTHLPMKALDEIFEKALPQNQKSYTFDELLDMAQKKYEVYHLHVMQGSNGKHGLPFWQDKLGQNCVVVTDYEEIPVIIKDITIQHHNKLQTGVELVNSPQSTNSDFSSDSDNSTTNPVKIIL